MSEKLMNMLAEFTNECIKEADEKCVNRDSFMQMVAHIFSMVVEVGTFENYQY